MRFEYGEAIELLKKNLMTFIYMAGGRGARGLQITNEGEQ